MAAVSRHRSLQTLREYVDEAEQFEEHAGAGLLSRRGGQELEDIE